MSLYKGLDDTEMDRVRSMHGDKVEPKEDEETTDMDELNQSPIDPSNDVANEMLKQGVLTPEQHAELTGISTQPNVPPADLLGGADPNAGAAPAGVGAPPQSGRNINALTAPQTSAASTPGAQNKGEFNPMDGLGQAPAARPSAETPAAPQQAPGNSRRMGETESSTQTTSMGSDAKSKFNDWMATAAERNKAEEESLREDAKLKGQQAAAENQILTKRIDEERERQAMISGEVRKRQSDIDKVTRQYNDMSVDSNRVFGDGQTSNKVFAAIGIALGALSEGLTGKDAGVVDILQKAIERDIDVQKTNIAKTGNQINLMRGGLQDYMAITRDETAAKDLEMKRQLDYVSNKFVEIANKNPDARIKAQALKSAEEIKSRAAQLAIQANTVTERTAKKEVDQVIKLGDYSDAVKDKVNSAMASLKNYDHLEELSDKLQDSRAPGVFEKWRITAARAAGIADPDSADFQSSLLRAQSEKVKELSGQVASTQEFNRVATQLMQMSDSPDTFRRLLAKARATTVEAIEAERRSARTSNKYDPLPDFDQYQADRKKQQATGLNSPNYNRKK